MGNICSDASSSERVQSASKHADDGKVKPVLRQDMSSDSTTSHKKGKSVQWADKDALETESSDGSGESGESDSDHEVDTTIFKISDRQKFFNGKKSLKKFLKRNLTGVDTFEKVECFGNSYDKKACNHIARLIKTKASQDLSYVDFSNMFVTRQATLPSSLRILIESI